MNRLENIFACLGAGLLLMANYAYAETALWSDNFETNAGSRWTASSVWQVGAPTFGPDAAHAGSKCAATGLKGNAPANADARFICTNYNGASSLAIPDASQFPRLRFWQWFHFVNAGGYVEIQQAGSTNWQVISATNISVGSLVSYSSDVWSRPSIDLRAFAGENVRIAFHFFSGGDGWGSDPGWFIDDVAVVTDAPVFNNPEGFEAGLGDWSVDAGTWQVGKPTSGPNSAHSGTNCAGTVLAGDYGWNVDTRLISPPFTVPASNNAALHFSQWYSFINAGGFVEVNNGTNSTSFTTNSVIITNSVTFTNYITATNGTTVTQSASWQAVSTTNISVGSAAVTSGDWKNTVIDLSAYSGQTVQVAFHFFSGGNGWGNAPGWYVDDILLGGSPMLVVPTNQTIQAGQTLTVTNFATNSFLTNALFTFTLPAVSTNAFITTNGVLTWTNTVAPAGTYLIYVKVADNNIPPLSATNDFSLTIMPKPPVLTVSPSSPGSHAFRFSFQTASSAKTRIDASTNLLTWMPIFTNLTGTSGTLNFTDLLVTNFPQRFYRAALP